MTILSEAPRGGLVDTLNGADRTFLLRNREIERFEDKHRGIFELWEGFFGDGKKPSSNEVRDILALALVGAGMKPDQADREINALGPENLMSMYSIAQAAVGIAFIPDAADQGSKKKSVTEDQNPQNSTSEA